MVDASNPLKGLISEDIVGEIDWATELTQAKILANLSLYVKRYAVSDTASLKKIMLNTAKMAGDKSIDKKLLKELEDSADSAEDQAGLLEEISKQLLKNNKTLKDIDSNGDMSRMAAIGNILSSGEALASGLQEIDQAGQDILNTVGRFDGDISGVFDKIAHSGIPLVGMMGAMAGIVMKQNSIWQELSSTGQSFNNDMFNMTQQLNMSGMGLASATKYLTQFSGVTSIVGSRDMLILQKSVREITTKFGNYGMTIDQVATFTGSLMEQQQIRGQFDKLNDAKQAQATAEYMKTLKTLATLTGRQVDEIDKEQRAMAGNVNEEQAYQRILHSKGREAADEFRKKSQRMIADTAAMNKEGQKMAMQAFWNESSGVTSSISETVAVFQSSGIDIGKMMRDIANANSPEEESKARARVVNAINGSADKVGKLTSMMGITGPSKGLADEITKIVQEGRMINAAIKNNGNGLADAIAKIKENLVIAPTDGAKATFELNKSIKRMHDAIGLAGATMQEILIPSINGVAGTFNKFIDISPLKNLSDLIRKNGGDVGAAIKELSKKIRSSIVNKGKDAVTDHLGTAAVGGSIVLYPWLKSAAKKVVRAGRGATEAESASVAVKSVIPAAIKSSGGLLKFAGKLFGRAYVLIGALKDAGDIALSLFKHERVKDEDIGALGGAASGALAGAIIGAPTGPGAAATAIVGAMIGGFLGEFAGKEMDESYDANKKKMGKKPMQGPGYSQTDADISRMNTTNNQVDPIRALMSENNERQAAWQKERDNEWFSRDEDKQTVDLLKRVGDILDITNQILIETSFETKNIAISVKRSEPDKLHVNHSM